MPARVGRKKESQWEELKNQLWIGSELKINTTGIGTFATLKADDVNISGVLTATSFVGRGHGLTGIPGETTGKIIGLHLIT